MACTEKLTTFLRLIVFFIPFHPSNAVTTETLYIHQRGRKDLKNDKVSKLKNSQLHRNIWQMFVFDHVLAYFSWSYANSS